MFTTQAQKKFFADFSAKVHDTAESVDLAAVHADSVVLEDLRLSMPYGKTELWGLIVFCSEGTYFYASAEENAMSSMLRQAVHADAPVEQITRLDTLPLFHIQIEQKHWYSFLFNDALFRINAGYEAGGVRRSFTLTTQRKAEQVYAKFPENTRR
jgi:hypothetical protein